MSSPLRFRFRMLWMVLLIVFLQLPHAQAASIYASKDFEAPDFTVGTIQDQYGGTGNNVSTNPWGVASTPDDDDAMIVNTFAKYGQQSLYLANSGNYINAHRYLATAVTTPVYFDFWIYPPHLAAVDFVPTFRIRDNSNNIVAEIALRTNRQVTINGSYLAPLYNINEWNRITVKADPVAATLDLYLNHQLISSGRAMKSVPVNGLRNWNFEFRGTGVEDFEPSGVFIDGFYISDENPLLFVENFGAAGDGATDDSDAIHDALDATKNYPYDELDNVTVVFAPDTTYMMGSTANYTPEIKFWNGSNFTIEGQNARLLMHPSIPPVNLTTMIQLVQCNNMRVQNLVLDGNRLNRGDPIGQVSGDNLIIRECADMVFDRILSLNAIRDGFYIYSAINIDAATFPQRILIKRCGTDNCVRQGISLINSKDVVIEDSWFHNSNGAGPESGIDIESNTGSAVPGNSNIVIRGCSFTGNAQWGLKIPPGGGGVERLLVQDNTFEDNHGAIFIGCSYSKFIGNTFGRSHPRDATNRWLVEFITTSSGQNHNNVFSDNRFVNVDHDATYDVRYLIRVSGAAGDYNVIANNAIIDCDQQSGDAYITNNQTTTVIKNNTVDGVPYTP